MYLPCVLTKMLDTAAYSRPLSDLAPLSRIPSKKSRHKINIINECLPFTILQKY